ncbi:MAG: ribonuclease P protein component [Patescibacteria group bacterium]|nr:ribonuclease P protein component [Patescibacteria group bacterium]
MFSKKFRLPATVSLSGTQVVSARFFTIRVKQNTLQNNRYGFVISKKISKRAHVRNRSKRKFRAGVEQLHSRLKTGYDMLFVLAPGVVNQSTQTLCTELEKTLQNFFIA